MYTQGVEMGTQVYTQGVEMGLRLNSFSVIKIAVYIVVLFIYFCSHLRNKITPKLVDLVKNQVRHYKDEEVTRLFTCTPGFILNDEEG